MRGSCIWRFACIILYFRNSKVPYLQQLGLKLFETQLIVYRESRYFVFLNEFVTTAKST